MKNDKKGASPSKRKPRVPIDYLSALADRMSSTNPTTSITFNTLKDVYCDAYADGYLRRIADSTVFASARELEMKNIFDTIKDKIDDVIFEKSNNEQPK